MSRLESPSLLMDEEESTASSFTGSPSMNSTIGSAGFDINYFLALTNPDNSSSSSESQSQASRATSPSDWINMAPTADHHDPTDPASWKFDTDALLISGVDPNALILGEEQIGYDGLTYPSGLQSFQFAQMIQAAHQQSSHQSAQTQSQYTIPKIIEPRPSASYAVHSLQQPQQAEHKPFIHAPQPQHPIVPPPAVRVTNSGAMVMDADAIGRRVRELAGIEYAVTAASQQAEIEHQPHPPVLPQLPQNLTGFPQQLPTGYAAPHAYSSPAPSSAGSSEASPSTIPQYGGAKPTKIKTPHTTIERRYRTNLNARIVALRHAVPALRILERDKFPNEKADERGYVDGVKAARKASKGSILGKAAEYIGVLKKREIRLRRDYEGLRALVYGLVGGPELLAHWDHVWQDQHPGDDEEAGSDEDGDDDDGSDDDDDKPRKKPKPASAPVASAAASSAAAVPAILAGLEGAGSPPDLKRKRGRPRKNPSQAAVPARPPMYLTQQQQQQPPQAAKYLMGVFLLFTFLNPATNPTTSNLATSSHSDSALTNHAHKHVGTVLTALNSTLFSHPATQYVASAPFKIEWSTVMQYAHALVTILLFFSIARNIVPPSWAPLFPKFLAVAPSPSPAEISRSEKRAWKADLALALAFERDNRRLLAHALGCSPIGLFDALRAGAQALIWSMLGLGKRTYNPAVRGAVVRLAELDLMHGESMPISYRLYHASRLYLVLSASLPSSSELTTFCVIAHGLPGARSFAASAWTKAQSLSSQDRFLFDRSLDDAVALYKAGHTIIGAGTRGGTGNGAKDGRITPLGLISSAIVCERIRDKAGELFTKESPSLADAQSVVAYAGEAPVGAPLLSGTDGGDQVQVQSDVSLDEVLALARGLTKPVRELAHLFEDVTAGIQPVTRGVSFIPDADEDEHDALSDAKFFLEAILLYRRITSVIQPTSPTPSETSTLFAGSSFSPSRSLSTSVSSRESSARPSTPNDSDLDSDSDSGDEDDEGMTSTGASSMSTDRPTKNLGKASVGSRLTLRRILSSSTFAASEEVNDARDRMVDFLVDTAWAQ